MNRCKRTELVFRDYPKDSGSCGRYERKLRCVSWFLLPAPGAFFYNSYFCCILPWCNSRKTAGFCAFMGTAAICYSAVTLTR